jgi:hypothetical protein
VGLTIAFQYYINKNGLKIVKITQADLTVRKIVAVALILFF